MISVPIYLIVFAAITTALGWSAFVIERSTRKAVEKQANSVKVVRRADIPKQLVSDKKHGLSRLWKHFNDWNWECECGRSGVLRSYDEPEGTEENAILAWRSHVETHERLVLPTNELSHQACDARFVGLWSLFENWRKACYCQTTSNDLILMNQEAKKFEPKKELENVSEEA